MKNNADVLIFHTAICSYAKTNSFDDDRLLSVKGRCHIKKVFQGKKRVDFRGRYEYIDCKLQSC